MRVTAIIPARYASTRFPGKPLVDILGKPMVRWVYERTTLCPAVDRVIVATDDERIFAAVQAFGGEAMMTRGDHPTGTDRLAEVAQRIETDLVVNVQGDEPLIDPRMIEEAVAPLLADPEIAMGTLMTPITEAADFFSPNVVKVVTDRDGFALYFSRSPIPHPRDIDAAAAIAAGELAPFRHIGLYVYRRDFLLRFPKLSSTPLEQMEKLEQLRALEHGNKIRVATTALVSHGVDTPEDLQRVCALAAVAGGK